MRALPSGWVTFVFTDIEGSTNHHQRLGPAFAAELEVHNSILGGAIERNGGHVVKTEGDGFFAAFADAGAAVRACVEAQEVLGRTDWPGGQPLRVRMGLHSGPAEVVDDDYVALAVNQAARVSAAGHGDQILVTAEIAERELTSEWTYEPLGEFRLRGFPQPVAVYQVVAAGLRSIFPTLRAPGVVNHNLPALPGPLVGRDDALAAVGRALVSERLVTLVGPGGIGKTSLAIAVAEAAAPRHSGGAWWVELATVKDADLVAEAVGAALGVLDQGGDVLTLVEHRLVAAPTLLVLDNCEHIAPGVVALLDRVLDRCPDVTLLTTSRIALGQRRERVVEVPKLGGDAAVALLAARRDGDSDLDDDETLAAIAERLDGLPLAIEIVAPLLDQMSAAEVLEGLETAGDGDGAALSPPMRASLAWSYDLLDEDAAACLRRLAVFAGPCSLDAAAAVCAAPGESPAGAVETLLDLADRSLVQVRKIDGRRRVATPATVRAFAAEHLDRYPGDGARDRHLAWYRNLAEAAAPTVLGYGPQRVQAGRRIAADVEDLRRALAHAAARGEADVAVTIGRVAASARWKQARFAEAARCLEAAIAAAPEASEGRAWSMQEMADVLFLAGDFAEAERWAIAAVEAAAAADAVEARGHALIVLARLGTVGKDLAKARELLDEAAEFVSDANLGLEAERQLGLGLCAGRDGDFHRQIEHDSKAAALARELGDVRLLATALTNVANAHINVEQFARGEEILREAVDLLDNEPTSATLVHALANLAYLAFRRDDFEEARRLGAEVLAFARASGHVFSLALGYNNLAEVELAAGNIEAAERGFSEGLSLGLKLAQPERICYCLEGLAATAAARGAHDRVVALLSFAERRRVDERAAVPDTYRVAYEALLVDARTALGADAFADAWQRGQQLELDGACELARTVTS